MKKYFLLLFTPFLAACSLLYEPDGGVPAYLYVPSVSVSSNYPLEGTASHNIQDIWVYIDDEVQGAYPLPAKIPILKEGTVRMRLNGGIYLSGISSTRAPYPHYAGFDTLIELERGITDTVIPQLRYNSDITFLWMEDFESQGITLRRNAQSDTGLLRVQLPNDSAFVFEGNNSMLAWVDQERSFFICESNTAFPLIRDGSNYFLELNYRNNVPISVGYIITAPGGSSYEQPIITLATTESWKKQYINLSPYILGSAGYSYRIVIAGIYNRSDAVPGFIQLDNLKLIQ